jgi:hypothetical protein
MFLLPLKKSFLAKKVEIFFWPTLLVATVGKFVKDSYYPLFQDLSFHCKKGSPKKEKIK